VKSSYAGDFDVYKSEREVHFLACLPCNGEFGGEYALLHGRFKSSSISYLYQFLSCYLSIAIIIFTFNPTLQYDSQTAESSAPSAPTRGISHAIVSLTFPQKRTI
jgi:hypothetical protein